MRLDKIYEAAISLKDGSWMHEFLIGIVGESDSGYRAPTEGWKLLYNVDNRTDSVYIV